MEDKLKEELLELLKKAKEHLNEGKTEDAVSTLSDIEDKLRPIGSGTNGPEPKK